MTAQTRRALEAALDVLKNAMNRGTDTPPTIPPHVIEGHFQIGAIETLNAFKLVTAALEPDEAEPARTEEPVLTLAQARTLEILRTAVRNSGRREDFDDEVLDKAGDVIEAFSTPTELPAKPMAEVGQQPPATPDERPGKRETENQRADELERDVRWLQSQMREIEHRLNIIPCKSDDSQMVRDAIIGGIRNDEANDLR